MLTQSAASTAVLIVGAGPTGLALAALLRYLGIEFIIIDRKDGLTDLSKALVMHARTLEVYDQLGLAEPAIALGARMAEVLIFSEGRLAAKPDFTKIAEPVTEYPFILVLGQSDNEALLNRHVNANGDRVRWQTRLTGLAQHDGGVTASIAAADGSVQTIAADYLVGCDGAGSDVRKLLNLGFEGSTQPRLFYVADVEMDEPLPGTRISVASGKMIAMIGKSSYVLAVPRPGARHWRFTGNLPHYDVTDRERELSFSDIEAGYRALSGRDANVTKVNWFSKYVVHTRNVDRFRVGRCFVAGDAGHVHTPAGGQGMNTGIQDAYNLAWKLAFALKHGGGDALLDSYHDERLANARHLVNTTDRLFEFLAGETWTMEKVRRYVFPMLARAMSSIGPVRKRTFKMLSETGITYRDQPLARSAGALKLKVKAGDRMPYFKLDDVGIYHWLRAPKFHVVAFGSRGREVDLARLKHRDILDLVEVPLDRKLAGMFGRAEPFTVVLRPDNHVATIFAGNDLMPVTSFLDVLLPQFERVPEMA